MGECRQKNEVVKGPNIGGHSSHRSLLVSLGRRSSYAAISVGKDAESRVSCCNRPPPRLDTSVHAGGMVDHCRVYSVKELVGY